IPEPMVFDLVRPLGASKGELEVNTLVQYDFVRHLLRLSPEIEYAFADGYAAEFESDTSVSGYKLTLQGTFSYPKSYHFIHGWQYMEEYYAEDKRYESTALYIFGYQFNEHWSMLNMTGVRRTALDSRGHF